MGSVKGLYAPFGVVCIVDHSTGYGTASHSAGNARALSVALYGFQFLI
jgi:hypothetical protein